MSAKTEAIAATVARLVADAPPLTAQTAAHIAALLGGGRAPAPTPEESARNEAASNLRRVTARYEAALEGCRGCDLPRAAHRAQQQHGMGYHAFQKLKVGDVLKVSQTYLPLIEAAERAAA